MYLFNSIAQQMAKAFTLAILSAPLFALPALAAKNDLRIGMTQYPSTLHPLFDQMVAKSLILGATLRPMTGHDTAWKPVCMSCVSLPTYENGGAQKVTLPDGRKGIAATYTLLPDLTWGDGTPVTTKDILFTWNVGKNPMSGVGNNEFYAKDIADIAVKDDKTFTITFAKEMCEFASIGDFYPLPAHLEQKIFDENPAEYQKRSLYVTAPATAGLYSGPYLISKIESGAKITISRNPHWKGATPAFNNVSFRTIENSTSLSSNLLSGEIDYIAGELGLSLDQALAFEKRLPKEKYTVTYKPSLTFEHIDLNLDEPTFKDINLRKALMHATDRNTINTVIFSGKQPVASSDINPLDTVYTEDTIKYAYDLTTAATLLDGAGWKLRPDGFRYNAKGDKLQIILSTTSGNKTRETILQAIQSDWKKAGIDSVIQNQPARVLFGDTMRERRFKGGVMYAWMSAPRNIPKTTLHSSMIPTAANNYGGQNYAGYNNPKMDKIIDDLEVVCDADKNLALWHDLQKIYADELPALPLYYRAEPFIVPVWLTGIVPTGHLNPSTIWIENWKASE